MLADMIPLKTGGPYVYGSIVSVRLIVVCHFNA